MGLREWSLGGVLLSPILMYALAALLVTGVLRLALQRVGMARWIWHEALFDCAPVSYTHLDVYKRQMPTCRRSPMAMRERSGAGMNSRA